MKKLLLASLCALFLIGCKKDKNENDNDIPASAYELSADGLTLVKWKDNSLNSVNMEQDSKLQKVTVIGERAFEGNKSVSSIVFPKALREIKPYAFNRANLDMRVTFTNYDPNTKLVLGNDVFARSEIREIKLPPVDLIPLRAFGNCKELRTIEFTAAKVVGGNAFLECEKLEVLDFGNTNVYDIQHGAVVQCKALKKVVLPETVRTIGKLAFYYNVNLESVTINTLIPPTVAADTFDDCNLIRFYVRSDVQNYFKTATNWSKHSSKIYPKP